MKANTSDHFVESDGRTEAQKTTSQHFNKVCAFLSPLQCRWPFVQEVLLWKRIEVSIAVFNLVNLLFWGFLTRRLQIVVSVAILLSLLWLIPPLRMWVLSNVKSRELSTENHHGNNGDSDGEVTEEHQSHKSYLTTNKVISYEDFCEGITVIWQFLSKYWLKLKNMKEESTYKFYGFITFLFVSVAVFYQRFAVANILYLTGSNKESDLSDEDEDFGLDPSKETEAILRAALPVERLGQENRAGPHDSRSSSAISAEGPEFPSLRRDSAESYNSDDFIDGLNFGSFNAESASCHSSMDSLVGNTEERLQSQHEHVHYNRYEEKPTRDKPEESYVKEEPTIRRRTREDVSEQAKASPRNESTDDLQGFEVVETSEIEQASSKTNEQDSQSSKRSYLTSGARYVRNLFGYS